MWLRFHQIGLAVESLSIKKCTQESGPNADDFNVAGVREKNVNLSHISKKKVSSHKRTLRSSGNVFFFFFKSRIRMQIQPGN